MCPTFTSDGLQISENPHGTVRALLRHTALHVVFRLNRVVDFRAEQWVEL